MPFLPLTAATFYQKIDALLADFPNVRAVGIGLPGVIVDGVVTSCDISLFCGLAVIGEVSARTGRYIQAGNDMNFTALGFYRDSCAGETAPVAYLFKPDVPCTGCGVVIGGQVLTGANNFAGEVSRLPFHSAQAMTLVEEMAKTVASLAALINPITVALSGTRLKESHLPDILRMCRQFIPEQHLPALVYRPSIREDYLQGIAELTMQNYTFHRLFTDRSLSPG